VLLPITLLCDYTRWQRLRRVERWCLGGGLAVSVWLLAHGVAIPSPAAVAGDAWARAATAPYVVATGILLGASWRMVVRDPVDDVIRQNVVDERRIAVGATFAVVASGVHRRR
jgi:hypothetical protein